MSLGDKIMTELGGQWRDRKVATGYRDPLQLQANPRNYRIHPESQQRIIESSLDKYGWFDDIKLQVDTDLIINGHARVLQAITRGEPLIPVTWYDLSDSECDEILAFLDPVASLAATDTRMYADLMADIERRTETESAVDQFLETARAEVEATVRRAERLARAQGRDEDALPEEDEVDPVVAAGEIWTLGDHRLLIGDARNGTNLALLMRMDTAQLVFTDPPYGVGYVGGTKKQRELIGDAVRGTEQYDLFLAPFRAASAYGDGGCAVFVFYANKVSLDLLVAVDDAGYEVRNEIVWTKNMAQFGALGSQYKNKHEPILYCVDPKRPPRWFGPNNEVTEWEVARSARNEYHPTQKPVALSERAINNHTAWGACVIDLYGGGGSTLIGCEKTGRHCRMMELDEKHAETIIRRWIDFTGGEAVREDDGVAFSDLWAEYHDGE